MDAVVIADYRLVDILWLKIMYWIWRKGSAEVIKIIFSLGYITVFIYFWLNINYRGTIESWATMYKEMKKIQTGNQVYCWSRKQTQKQRRISGFCRSIIFFGIKNVRVGGKILGSVSRSETHIFFFWPKIIIKVLVCEHSSKVMILTLQ